MRYHRTFSVSDFRVSNFRSNLKVSFLLYFIRLFFSLIIIALFYFFLRWYIYKVFYISNINIDSIACHSHSRFIYSNNILFISTYIKYVWNILTFKINLNLNLIKKKILKSTKKNIDPNFFNQRLYYVFSILLFQKIHEKLLLSSYIHPRPRTHWKRSSRHFKSWPISRYNSVALQLFPFSLSLSVSKTIVPNFEKIYIPPCPMSPHTPPSLSPRTP